MASDRGYIWDDPRNAWTASTLAHNIVAVDGANQNVPGRTDTIISTPDDQQRRFGPITLAGRFAFVSIGANANPQQAYLLAGLRLACGGIEINLPTPTIPLDVESVTDRTFHLAENLPPNLNLPGKYVLAADTGYEIESTTQRSVTIRDYPAVDSSDVKILRSAWLER